MDAFEHLTAQINEHIAGIEEALVSGRLTSYEEYKRLCGEIRGLLTARDLIKDLRNRMENSDDE